MIVAHARAVRFIRRESEEKVDRLDAQTLARLARIDPELLCPVKHRSAKAQADLTVIRARAGLVRARTALVDTVRGLARGSGERLRGCNVRDIDPEKAEGLSPELQRALEPLLAGIETLDDTFSSATNDRKDGERFSAGSAAETGEGCGTLIALTYLLTLEDAQRFRKSRDVGSYLGLQPGPRDSGRSKPRIRIIRAIRICARCWCRGASYPRSIWSGQ